MSISIVILIFLLILILGLYYYIIIKPKTKTGGVELIIKTLQPKQHFKQSILVEDLVNLHDNSNNSLEFISKYPVASYIIKSTTSIPDKVQLNDYTETITVSNKIKIIKNYINNNSTNEYITNLMDYYEECYKGEKTIFITEPIINITSSFKRDVMPFELYSILVNTIMAPLKINDPEYAQILDLIYTYCIVTYPNTIASLTKLGIIEVKDIYHDFINKVVPYKIINTTLDETTKIKTISISLSYPSPNDTVILQQFDGRYEKDIDTKFKDNCGDLIGYYPYGITQEEYDLLLNEHHHKTNGTSRSNYIKNLLIFRNNLSERLKIISALNSKIKMSTKLEALYKIVCRYCFKKDDIEERFVIAAQNNDFVHTIIHSEVSGGELVYGLKINNNIKISNLSNLMSIIKPYNQYNIFNPGTISNIDSIPLDFKFKSDKPALPYLYNYVYNMVNGLQIKEDTYSSTFIKALYRTCIHPALYQLHVEINDTEHRQLTFNDRALNLCYMKFVYYNPQIIEIDNDYIKVNLSKSRMCSNSNCIVNNDKLLPQVELDRFLLYIKENDEVCYEIYKKHHVYFNVVYNFYKEYKDIKNACINGTGTVSYIFNYVDKLGSKYLPTPDGTNLNGVIQLASVGNPPNYQIRFVLFTHHASAFNKPFYSIDFSNNIYLVKQVGETNHERDSVWDAVNYYIMNCVNNGGEFKMYTNKHKGEVFNLNNIDAKYSLPGRKTVQYYINNNIKLDGGQIANLFIDPTDFIELSVLYSQIDIYLLTIRGGIDDTYQNTINTLSNIKYNIKPVNFSSDNIDFAKSYRLKIKSLLEVIYWHGIYNDSILEYIDKIVNKLALLIIERWFKGKSGTRIDDIYKLLCKIYKIKPTWFDGCPVKFGEKIYNNLADDPDTKSFDGTYDDYKDKTIIKFYSAAARKNCFAELTEKRIFYINNVPIDSINVIDLYNSDNTLIYALFDINIVATHLLNTRKKILINTFATNELLNKIGGLANNFIEIISSSITEINIIENNDHKKWVAYETYENNPQLLNKFEWMYYIQCDRYLYSILNSDLDLSAALINKFIETLFINIIKFRSQHKIISSYISAHNKNMRDEPSYFMLTSNYSNTYKEDTYNDYKKYMICFDNIDKIDIDVNKNNKIKLNNISVTDAIHLKDIKDNVEIIVTQNYVSSKMKHC